MRESFFGPSGCTWPWVKSQIVPPVNIPIPTMGGEFTYPQMGSQNGFGHHSHKPSPQGLKAWDSASEGAWTGTTKDGCCASKSLCPKHLHRFLFWPGFHVLISPQTSAQGLPLLSLLGDPHMITVSVGLPFGPMFKTLFPVDAPLSGRSTLPNTQTKSGEGTYKESLAV